MCAASPAGEEFEDDALALLRGSNSCGHLGIWPAAAMINHACCPNAHALLIGDRLVRKDGFSYMRRTVGQTMELIDGR
jgi:hypothetical protein